MRFWVTLVEISPPSGCKYKTSDAILPTSPVQKKRGYFILEDMYLCTSFRLCKRGGFIINNPLHDWKLFVFKKISSRHLHGSVHTYGKRELKSKNPLVGLMTPLPTLLPHIPRICWELYKKHVRSLPLIVYLCLSFYTFQSCACARMCAYAWIIIIIIF